MLSHGCTLCLGNSKRTETRMERAPIGFLFDLEDVFVPAAAVTLSRLYDYHGGKRRRGGASGCDASVRSHVAV